jgi:hypothetical protein
VALSWSAVTPPGAGTVAYTVSRNGNEAGGSCSSTLNGTSCIDSGLLPGTYNYVVRAKWRSWTADSTPKSAKVTIGPADHFIITAASANPAAGASDNLTLTAKDAAESTVTTYTGSHNLIFSGASASPSGKAPTVSNASGTDIAFGTATSLTFTNGVASPTSSTKNGVMKLYRAGAASISASEESLSTKDSLNLTVAPIAASKIVLSAATTNPVAGATDALTTTAQDTYGNVATTYTGAKSLIYSGASASATGNAPTVSDSSGNDVAFGAATPTNFSAGVASASGNANGVMKLYKSGSASIKVSDGAFTSATISTTTAAALASRLSVSPATTTPVAAASDNLTTTALDPYGNTATSYTGAHELTFSGATASPSGAAPTVANSAGTAVAFGSPTALNFTNGVASVSSGRNGVLKLNRVETANVSVTDGAISIPAPIAFTVSTGTASRLGFTQISVSAGTLSSPCLFTCTLTGLGNSGTVTARIAVTDSVGNTASNVGTGHTVKVTTNGGGAIVGTPLTIASSGPAESTATFTFTAKSSGSFAETVTAANATGTPAYTSATLNASK